MISKIIKSPITGMFIEVCKTIVFVISLFICCACFLIGIKEKCTGEMAFVGGIKPVYIISGSMEPGIRTGAIVIIEQAGYENVDIGDVITFKTDAGYVTHRLIGIDKTMLESGNDSYLITKGDANNVEDMARLNPSDIKGKIIGVFNLFSVFRKFIKIN